MGLGLLDDGVADERLGTRHLRRSAMLTLTLLTCALSMTVRLGSASLAAQPGVFSPSTAVFLAQLVNLAVSLTATLPFTIPSRAPPNLAPFLPACESPDADPRWRIPPAVLALGCSILSCDAWPLALPALLAVIQDTAAFQQAVRGAPDAVQFHVLYQLRIVATACFSVLLLRRLLSLRAWAAVFALTAGASAVWLGAGVVRIAVPLGFHGEDAAFPRSLHELGHAYRVAEPLPALSRRSATYEGIAQDAAASPAVASSATAAALVAGFVSSLAAVLLERCLKQPPPGLDTRRSPGLAAFWLRNAQLALLSLVICGGSIVLFDHGLFITGRLLDGFGLVAWLAVVLHGLTAALTSMCISCHDSITATFASTFGLVLCLAIEIVFGALPSAAFFCGILLVLASAYLHFGASAALRPGLIEASPRLIGPAMPAHTLFGRLPLALRLKPPLSASFAALSTSRPASPAGSRARTPLRTPGADTASAKGYFCAPPE